MTGPELELVARALARVATAGVLLEAAADHTGDTHDHLVAQAYAATVSARGELVACIQSAELSEALAPTIPAPRLHVVR